MKKIFALVLCLAMVSAVISGCGGTTSSSAPAASSSKPASSSAATSSAAASSTGTVVSETVKKAAMAYFETYDSAKIMKSATDFLKAVGAGEKMFVIDVRQADVYAKGHIKGAVNLPFGSAIAENLALIPNDVQVYVYCYTGQTASQVVALLNVAGIKAANVQKGYDNGIALEAGFEKYLSTEATAMPTKKYDVNTDIQKAITKYFEDVKAATGTAFASFNFKSASLKEALDAKDTSYYVYNIQKAEDFAKGHIATSVNNPFAAGMQKKFADLPANKTIIVQCYTGQTASQTMAILRLLGYKAYSLHGGIGSVESKAGWLGAGYSVVTD